MAATRPSGAEALALYRAIHDPDNTTLAAPADIDRNETQRLTNLGPNILKVRANNFDQTYQDESGNTVLVKIHHGETQFNPIDPNEAEVQSLRYLQGMLIITNNLPTDSAVELTAKIGIIHHHYQQRLKSGKHTADNTLWLTDQFATLLANNLGVSHDKALKQLTMARDIGILLEDHPSVCTVTETSTSVTIEKSIPYKISTSYYDQYIPESNVNDQPWLQSANKLAGLKTGQDNNWLERFFNNTKNRKLIVGKGASAPPSARWLPIPANAQVVSIDHAKKEKGKEPVFSRTEFVRSGIAIPYDIRHVSNKKPYTYQKKVAKDILKELMRAQLAVAIENFRHKYDDMLGPINNVDFYVNYQTLLSPLIAERRLGHVDNNARFVKMAKEVMEEIRIENPFKDIAEKHHVNLIYKHSNSAINRNAKYTVSYNEDKDTRLNKISSFENMLKQSIGAYTRTNFETKIRNTRYPQALQDELINRQQACYALQDLLDNKPPYAGMKTYQRNITMAALEMLVCGSQALNIDGCKSARDRTAVFACAAKVMQENPDAMRNWKMLEDGIKLALNQGHHFRSMIFHSAIIKAALVHKDFMKGFSATVQTSIKKLLVFSRKPPTYEEPKRMLASDARFFEKVRHYISRPKRKAADTPAPDVEPPKKRPKC